MEGRIPLIGEKFPEMKVFTTDGVEEKSIRRRRIRLVAKG